MADHKKHGAADENAIENLNEHLTATSRKLVENKKVVLWIAGILVVCGLFVVAWIWFYYSPRVNNSLRDWQKAQIEAKSDTLLAEDLAKVANKYGSAPGGNLAALQAAEQYYDLGNYQAAINMLEKFSTGEPVVKAQSKVLEGDCYVNLKKYGEAHKCYAKAVDYAKGNPAIVPFVLMKEARVYEEEKNYEGTLRCYQTIKNEYPEYQPQGASIDAYIGRCEGRLRK